MMNNKAIAFKSSQQTDGLLLKLVVLSFLVMSSLHMTLPLHAAATPVVGSQAPEFDLMDQNNKRQRLKDYQGEWLVLYFYPKDDTPGCTTEACNFRDDYFRIRALGAVVMGVSLDDVASHKAFSEKYHLPFSLLADDKKEVARSYNVLRGFGTGSYSSRQTFIIDPQGKIAKHYASVSARQHATEIIHDLKKFTAQPDKKTH